MRTMKKDEFIFQSNQVVLSRINLANIYEKRLLNAFVNSVSPHLQGMLDGSKGKHIAEQKELDFGVYETITYTYNLSDVEPNPQNYDRLRIAIRKLRETSVDVVLEDGTELFTGLIQSAVLKTKQRSETFKVKLSVPAYQYLLDISKGYSIKSFLTSLDLKNLYSSYVYDLLCKWRNKPTFEIDLEHLRFVTNAPKSYRANDIKTRVLNPAKKELDESDVSDLTFTYEDIRRGRSIIGFRIHIFHTKNDSLTVSKLTKEVSPNWDFEKSAIEYLNRNEINFNGKNRELLKKFFKLNGTSKGLDFLEKAKDAALRKARNNPQGYIISAVKKHIEQRTEPSTSETADMQNMINKMANQKTKK